MKKNNYYTVIVLFCSSYLWSQPEGLTVTSGQAVISSIDSQVTIQSKDQTVLEWHSFSIEEKEHLHFEQLGINPSVLNKVTGSQASSILGHLTSNGKVFLVNPAGILIGPNAKIETAGFMGSTFDLFDQPSDAKIINQGTISCLDGDIVLTAASIENEGILEALNGKVDLHGGIKAHPYLLAISHTGKIRSVTQDGGEIYLVAEEGICEFLGSAVAHNNEKGGTVHLLGDEVRLLDDAFIDASGDTGGGTVLVGGDFQGKNLEIKNAKRTWAGPNTQVIADAKKDGNGGKVIFWSDEATFHYGNISVRGGEERGNGGLVEVSGDYLDYQGVADRRAPNGRAGDLLLDPCAVTISTGANANNSFGSNAYTFSAATATINIANLIQNLSLGNVTVDATASGSGTASITIANPITGAGGGTGSTSWTNNNLTLNGGTAITVNASSAISWGGTGTLSMTTTSGPITINSGITNNSATTGFTAISMNSTSSSTNSGIVLVSGVLTTSGGNVSLIGSAPGSGATAVRGVHFNGGSITSGAGNISVGGSVTGGSGTSVGVLLATTNAITSTTGRIAISGTSAASGASSHGVSFTSSCASGTSGTTTFGGTIGSISGCIGGSGATSHGINLTAGFTSAGNIVATNLIQGGTGSGSIGFNNTISFGASGSSGTITIQITASSQATAGAAHGISLTSFGAVRITGLATHAITLIGTGGNSNSTSHGVNLAGSTADFVSTVNGPISIGGIATGSGQSSGVNISGTQNPILSTSGQIFISGTSASSGSSSHGVSLTGSAWSPGTSGTITFGSTITDGTVTVSGCVGGSGSASMGLFLQNQVTTSGNVIATNFIKGGTGGGSCIGFWCSGSISANSTQITASGQSTTGDSIGIYVSGSISASSTNQIKLIGIGGNSSVTAHGVSIPGTISSGSGSISVGGIASGIGSAAGIGVNLAGSNSITSGSGQIFVSGTSTAPGSSAHGVSVNTNSWTTGTSGTLTFGSTITDGTATVSGCSGGSGSSSNGINIATALSTTGSIVATNLIQGGTGSDSVGFASAANVTASGASGTIQITASSQGTAGTAHGISITGGTISTSNASGGAITLIGTGGNSIGNAHGVNISGTGLVSTATSNAVISIGGIATGTSTGAGVGVNIAGSTNSITSGTGNINVSGTSSAPGSSSYGVSVNTNSWITGSTGTLTFGSSITDGTVTVSGCTGGLGSASHGLNVAAALTNLGNIVFTGTAGGGAGSFDNSFSSNVTTSGGVITVTGSTILGGSTSFNTTNAGAITAGASIIFSGSSTTIDGTSAGSQSLTLTAGTSGAVTFGAPIGQTTSLGNLTIVSAKISANAISLGGNINANTFTVTTASPVVLANSVAIDTSANPSSSIAFGGALDATNAETQALTLTAGSSGNISFSGAVGSSVRLGSVTVISANNVIMSNSLFATSFTQNAGSGMSTFNGAFNTTSNISLTGTNFTFNGSVTATSVMITNSGITSIQGGVGMTLSGAFSQVGGLGSVSLGAGILTNQQPITFTSPITLTSNAYLETVGASGISFNGASTTIDGGYDLFINAGNSTVQFGAPVGSATPLRSLYVYGTGGITVTGDQTVLLGPVNYIGTVSLQDNSVFTSSGSSSVSFLNETNAFSGNYDLEISASSSPITVVGATNLSGSADMTGTTINLGSAFTTTGNGSVTFSHTGQMTVNGTILASQNFTDNGGGGTQIQGVGLTIQANNDATFSNAITCSSGATSLTLSAGRSIFLNEDITTANASLTVTANDLIANGIVNAYRQAGDAGFTIANNVMINSGSGSVSLLLSTGAGKTYTGASNLLVGASSTLQATGSGAISVQSQPTTIILGLNSNFQTQNGDLFFLAGQDVQATGATTLTATGAGGLTIVTDALYPTSPSYGTGKVVLGSAVLTAGSSTVLIYTSQPDLSTFPTVINGEPFVETPETEAVGVYYPDT